MNVAYRRNLSSTEVAQPSCESPGADAYLRNMVAGRARPAGCIHLRVALLIPALPKYNRPSTKGVNAACKSSAASADLRRHELQRISVAVVETMRNGSQPPRRADRRLRVGPGRPAGCPRRTPGEARRRKFVFWFGGSPRSRVCQSPGGGYSWISELPHPDKNTETKTPGMSEIAASRRGRGGV